ncbi:DUF4111 domain-containing protein [Cryobacterium sp. TMT1-66-1]|nr:DUF4111 domain-containing protein [Cryobacterium sp. TMT1-66-1]
MADDALLPGALRNRVTVFVREHVRIAPGLLDRVIVIGSAVVGDWWEGISDIDLVLVTRRSLRHDELVVLGDLHRSTISEGPIDGVHLTEQQLDAGPERIGVAPQVIDGELDEQAPGARLSWVTWREVESGIEGFVGTAGAIAWSPSTRRFPRVEEGVRAFSRQNLRDYWRPLGAGARAQLSPRPDGDPVDAVTLRWIALGPARLVATLETGNIISKSASGTFAAQRWPEYVELLSRAVASRTGINESFTAADERAALNLLDKCVAVAEADSRSRKP